MIRRSTRSERTEENVWRRGVGGRGWGVVERDDLKGGDG